MTDTLKRRLVLDARRIVLVAVLGFVSGVLFYAHLDVTMAGLPLPLAAGFMYAGGGALGAAFVCLVLPGARLMIDAIAASRLLVSFAVFLMPEAGMFLLTSPMLLATLIVAGGILLRPFLHGLVARPTPRHWRDRLLPPTLFVRQPVRCRALGYQRRFIRWVDRHPPQSA